MSDVCLPADIDEDVALPEVTTGGDGSDLFADASGSKDPADGLKEKPKKLLKRPASASKKVMKRPAAAVVKLTKDEGTSKSVKETKAKVRTEAGEDLILKATTWHGQWASQCQLSVKLFQPWLCKNIATCVCR